MRAKAFLSQISMENGQPIFFGDDESGYCISLTFPCQDFYARGSQRLYSLCYFSPDKHHLLAVMNFVGTCLRQMAFWLQCDANETYRNEGHVQIEASEHGEGASVCVDHPSAQVLAQRMLSDIVGDSKVVYRLHALFVWVLRATNSAIQESLSDGLPMAESSAEEKRTGNGAFDRS